MQLDKKQISNKIKQELIDTESLIIELKELTKPIAPDCAIGRVSRMDAINNKTINEAALRKAVVKLSSLKYALERIDDKDFGICAKCQQAIPIGRVLLMPHSRFCARCVD
ncbi:MAG TPA: TraR/DksA family transcriptional regulator [Lutibacter sp.]|nr:TraR/DksA family transcriptional regulator [Lutibacter sp.]